MIGLHAQHRYYLYAKPADMRKSFDGLSGLVRNHMDRNPLEGEVYVFLNRQRSIIKLLVWDRTGFSIYSKRLERGSFERPRREEGPAAMSLSWEELVLILEGISLGSVRRRKRYKHSQQGVKIENQAQTEANVENPGSANQKTKSYPETVEN
jgi:transposase